MTHASRASGEGQSPIHFPQGPVLIDLAGEYKTLYAVVMELVANELDANARSIFVVVNKKKRKITVAGNGKGMTEAEFDRAFASVRRSMKDKTKFGQYGLGFISALGKCVLTRYISRSRNQAGGYQQYTLVTDDVRAQDVQAFVPHKPRPDIVHRSNRKPPSGATVVEWNTLVEIEKYTDDRYIADLQNAQSIADGIEERYGAGMLKTKAEVTVQVVFEDGKTVDTAKATGKHFRGRKLGVITLQKRRGGNIIFDLYLARKTKTAKRGKVLVGQTFNDFRVPFRDMVKTSPGFVSEEVEAGLLSGIFDGEILLEKATLLKSRKGFEENEPFVDACLAIDEWFAEHGKEHLNEEKELRNGERYQQLGERLLVNIEDLPILAEVVPTFSRGTVGPGHFDPEKLGVVGVQDHRSLSIEGTAGKGVADEGGGPSGRNPESEKPDHHPLTSAGPHGKRRIVVRKGSKGLQIAHDRLDGQAQRYELDTLTGILTFNVRHPDFQELESDMIKISQYEEILVAHALVLHALPQDWDKTSVGLGFDCLITQHVHQIKNSASFNWKRKKSSS